MPFRSIAPFMLASAAALLPAAVSAQQTADEAMQSLAGRAHFHIRQAELCRQPDDATRQAMSSKILAWVDAEAARVGVPASALADAASDGVSQAESRLGNTPSAQDCATSTQHFNTFLADTMAQRKSAQTVLLGRHTRAMFQLRTAQLCKLPDEARQADMAARLDAWFVAAAAEAGVLPATLAENGATATRAADGDYARDSSAKRCQQNAASLITMSGG